MLSDYGNRERRPSASSRNREGGEGGSEGSEGGRGRFQRRERKCAFCVDKSSKIDYKDANGLRYYVTEQGRIRPRRQTGMCARHQRQLATAVKSARHLAMLPFVLGSHTRP